MKKLLTKFASSFAALLSDSTILDVDGKAEDIRDAMLEAMAPHMNFDDVTMPGVWTRTVKATDIQSLWYMRSDVLAFLAEQVGEPTARTMLNQITEMFRGAMPDSHMPRPRKIVR